MRELRKALRLVVMRIKSDGPAVVRLLYKAKVRDAKANDEQSKKHTSGDFGCAIRLSIQ